LRRTIPNSASFQYGPPHFSCLEFEEPLSFSTIPALPPVFLPTPNRISRVSGEDANSCVFFFFRILLITLLVNTPGAFFDSFFSLFRFALEPHLLRHLAQPPRYPAFLLPPEESFSLPCPSAFTNSSPPTSSRTELHLPLFHPHVLRPTFSAIGSRSFQKSTPPPFSHVPICPQPLYLSSRSVFQKWSHLLSQAVSPFHLTSLLSFLAPFRLGEGLEILKDYFPLQDML